jgi:glycerol uptake facilitator-like aquaporin
LVGCTTAEVELQEEFSQARLETGGLTPRRSPDACLDRLRHSGLNTPSVARGTLMDQKLRTYLAELVGTFVVVLVAAGTVCASQLTWIPPLDVTGIALAYGFAYAVVLTVIYPLSAGCLNPAVTLMLWVFRRLESRPTAVLIAMQLLGSALAGLVLRLAFDPKGVLVPARLGTPHLSPAFVQVGEPFSLGSLVSGTGWELFFGFLVTLALLATLLDPRAPRQGGILAGLAQAAR